MDIIKEGTKDKDGEPLSTIRCCTREIDVRTCPTIRNPFPRHCASQYVREIKDIKKNARTFMTRYERSGNLSKAKAQRIFERPIDRGLKSKTGIWLDTVKGLADLRKQAVLEVVTAGGWNGDNGMIDGG